MKTYTIEDFMFYINKHEKDAIFKLKLLWHFNEFQRETLETKNKEDGNNEQWEVWEDEEDRNISAGFIY